MLRAIRARCLGSSGAVKDAIHELSALLEDQARVLGADAPDTLTSRNNLAYLKGKQS